MLPSTPEQKTTTMFGEEKEEEEKVEEVVGVDAESFDFTNDLFRKTYGSNTMDDAQARNQTKQRQASRGFVNEGLEVATNARLSHFEKEKVYANEWTNSCLNVIEATLLECQKAAAAHMEATRACRHKHRMMSIPLIIIGTAATALSFLSAGATCSSEEDDSSGEGVKYVVAVLTSLASVGAGVSALYSFSNKQTEHIAAGGAFTNLARRIRCQLFLPNHLRAQAEVCLVDFGAEQSHLVNTSPLL